jgi:hypothetical protein
MEGRAEMAGLEIPTIRLLLVVVVAAEAAPVVEPS